MIQRNILLFQICNPRAIPLHNAVQPQNNPKDLCCTFLSDSCSTSNSTDVKTHKHHTGKEELNNEIDAILAAEFSMM